MSKVYEKLLIVQSKLKAPKGQRNTFGNYNYRSCEDILEALKPILAESNASTILRDELVQIGERYYIKATAIFIDCESGETVETVAYAREDETKKGMDLAQITGSVSSYARKYALNGLYCIDDAQDSDVPKGKPKAEIKPITEEQIQEIFELGKKLGYEAGKVIKDIENAYKITDPTELNEKQYKAIITGYNKTLAAKGK